MQVGSQFTAIMDAIKTFYVTKVPLPLSLWAFSCTASGPHFIPPLALLPSLLPPPFRGCQSCMGVHTQKEGRGYTPSAISAIFNRPWNFLCGRACAGAGVRAYASCTTGGGWWDVFLTAQKVWAVMVGWPSDAP